MNSLPQNAETMELSATQNGSRRRKTICSKVKNKFKKMFGCLKRLGRKKKKVTTVQKDVNPGDNEYQSLSRGDKTTDVDLVPIAPQPYPSNIVGGSEVRTTTFFEKTHYAPYVLAFALWFPFMKRYCKSNTYKKRRELFPEGRFSVYPMLVKYQNGERWYITMTKDIFNGVCQGDWSYETKSKVEVSKTKLKDLHGRMRIRKDNLLTVTLKLSVPELRGGCRFYILNREKKHFDQRPGSFDYSAIKLELDVVVTLKEIDKNFQEFKYNFRAPELSLKYNVQDFKIKALYLPYKEDAGSKRRTHDIGGGLNKEKMLQVLHDFIEKQLLGAKEEIAQRLERNLMIQHLKGLIEECRSLIDIGTLIEKKWGVELAKPDEKMTV